MRFKSAVFASLGILFAVSGCGQNVEPTFALGDPNRSYMNSMDLPMATGTFIGIQPYSSSQDGIALNANMQGAQVIAPEAGLVTFSDAASRTVIILHNVHVSTRIRNVTPTVQTGMYVNKSQLLGTTILGSAPLFSVIVDNVSICPTSYLSSGARTAIGGAKTCLL